MGAQISVATGHLWLEEALGGDTTAKESLAAIDRALYLINAARDGGTTDNGFILLPLKDPGLRSQLDALKGMIMNFRRLARERLSNPAKAGVGSLYDQRFDALFKDILAKASTLEEVVEESNAQDRLKSGRIFLGILLAWAFIVAAATAGFWNRERRRKSAEQALLDAHEQLLAQAEELTAHREAPPNDGSDLESGSQEAASSFSKTGKRA